MIMDAVDLTITVVPINYTAIWHVTLSFLKQKKKRLSPCNASRRSMKMPGDQPNQALPFFLSFFFFSTAPAPEGSPPIPDIMPASPSIPGIDGIPGIPCMLCISAMASLNGLSLTPPPLYAGE